MSVLFCIADFWLAFVALLWGIWHFDLVAVAIIERFDLPFFDDARLLAASIYRYPDQWRIGDERRLYTDDLRHPKLGRIKRCFESGWLTVTEGSYGDWTPNRVERRIIRNAARWLQKRELMKSLKDVGIER